MTPKNLSAWIDRLRGMLDDPLVSCEQAVRDVVDCELDALELQLLREAVTVTQTITVDVQATGAAQLAREIAQALSTGRSSRRRR